jgi:outer membrane protein insertion porin family
VLVDSSRTRIRALGFFSEVTITEEPGSQPDRTVLNVAVTEQPTGELSVGAGYSSQADLIGELSYTERNLFGRGQYLRASVSYSAFQKQYQFNFIEPYFGGRPLQAGIQAYDVLTDYTEQAGYQIETKAIGILFGFPVSEYGRLSPHYNFQWATVDATANAPLAVTLSQGTASTSSVGFTYTYDTRDDPLNTTKGMTLTFSQDVAGLGGDLKYLRTDAGLTFYRPWTIFGAQFVGQISFVADYISSYGGQNVRINDRFFRGGPSFRGFELAGIGPRDIAAQDRVALGGQLFLRNTVQLRLPQILPENFGVRLSLFNDFGTLGYLRGVSKDCRLEPESVTNPVTGVTTYLDASCIKDDLAPRASAGVAINWRSPFGPVEIDLGYPYLKEDYDRVQAIYFSTSTNF